MQENRLLKTRTRKGLDRRRRNPLDTRRRFPRKKDQTAPRYTILFQFSVLCSFTWSHARHVVATAIIRGSVESVKRSVPLLTKQKQIVFFSFTTAFSSLRYLTYPRSQHKLPCAVIHSSAAKARQLKTPDRSAQKVIKRVFAFCAAKSISFRFKKCLDELRSNSNLFWFQFVFLRSQQNPLRSQIVMPSLCRNTKDPLVVTRNEGRSNCAPLEILRNVFSQVTLSCAATQRLVSSYVISSASQ